MPAGRLRVLVTGAGGPAAIAAMKSLAADPAVELLAADMDPWAAGLYLVPSRARTLIPAGDGPGFRGRRAGPVPRAGRERRPADGRRRAATAGRAPARVFAAAGIDLLLAPAEALDVILDKLALAQRCAGIVRVPRTELFGSLRRPGGVDVPGHRQAADGQRVARHPAGRFRRRAGRA